jgi:uncharacterized membrane protein (GlpM family)
MLYYTIQFVIGGLSVVAITWITAYISPKYAGIIYAVPIILIVASFFVYINQGLEVTARTLKSTFVYEFTLIYFILAFYLLLRKVGFGWAMMIALVTWIGLASLIQRMFKL